MDDPFSLRLQEEIVEVLDMCMIVIDLKFYFGNQEVSGYELVKADEIHPTAAINLFMEQLWAEKTITEERNKKYVNPSNAMRVEVEDWKIVPEDDCKVIEKYMVPHEITDRMVEDAVIENL
ncbi:hypothetical protein AKJ51_00085 [candidate division MSBL1 archaeon SCGC-AAA382A20]|uniref:Uncharacterized protein n=1 Tax=candidate division MSBL1 archaeon SCGC-AAA382A20 TaxID=1698280 RepID=A0A133VMR7_9EURY|nr:hypothetical protein AKJ51_00085 [candidate division MSBL1 archaeon SCGC-AAA382A20]